MKKSKRTTALMLAVIMVISVILPQTTLQPVYADDVSKMHYEDGFRPEFYSQSNDYIFEGIKADLPPNTPKEITVKGQKVPFNYRLWFAKNIIVYGNWSNVNPRPNDFKAETTSPYGVGYYSKNGVRGEYRYHGFDIAGNKYSNTWFTIDVVTTSSINDNRWIHHPWGDAYRLVQKISPWNKAATDPLYQDPNHPDYPDYQATKRWINNPITKDGVTLTFENAMGSSREAKDYVHIMTPPSLKYPGEGKAWHLFNGQVYYRTFTLDRLNSTPGRQDKLMTDVQTTVTILTPPEKLKIEDYGTGNTPEYLNSEVEVEVLVKGHLLDENYYSDPVKKVTRYTREDVKDWTISLGTDTRTKVKPNSPNTAEQKFTLKFKRSAILQQQEWTLSGKAQANFVDGRNNFNTGSATLKFTVEKKTPIEVIKEMTPVEATLQVLTPAEGRTVINYGNRNTAEYLQGYVYVDVKVTGTLLDSSFYNNPEERKTKYNRDDIQSWTLGANGNDYPGIEPLPLQKNKAENIVTLKFQRAEILSSPTQEVHAKAKVQFVNGKTNEATTSGTITFIIQPPPSEDSTPPPPEPPLEIEEPPPPPIIVQPDCHMPNEAFDIIPFPAYDNTDMEGVAQRTVYINGEAIPDSDYFFSGNYVFGEENEGLKFIEVAYESVDGITTTSTHWVYVYSTKPKAQFKVEGTFKQNRKLSATENCNEGNVQIVLQNYPIVSYEWSVTAIDGNISSFRARETGNTYKEFMFKEPGTYRMTLTVTNTLGRVSDPYVLDMVIYPDVEPAIEINIWNGVLTRGEELNLHYSVSSVDEDIIAVKSLKLYYDSNNDGTCEQLVKTFTDGEFTGYAPDKLGKYKLVAEAKEEFGQLTLPEYITVADKKTKTFESEFWVDNLAPMTDMYIDAPIPWPEVDVYIMMDKNLSEERREYIFANRVNFINTLRAKNILAKVELWDMKTYEYSQYVYATRTTGTSYPPQTIQYSSGGYSGTLSRYNVVDNGYYYDFGYWSTQTQSKEFTRTHSNTITKMYWDGYLYSTTESNPEPSSYYINEDGYSGYIPKVSRDGPYNYRVYDQYYSYREFERTHQNTVTDYYNYYTGYLVASVQTSPAPSSYYINEDGYSGYIPRVGTTSSGITHTVGYYNGIKCDIYQQTFTAIYRGTLSKLKSYKTDETYISTYRGTLTKTVQVWVPDVRWVNDYTGYYSGTVYKYVRQPYTDPFRATSDKYVVYVSDGIVNELSDLQMVMSKADARLILVGSESIKGQINYDLYISKDKPIEEIMSEVLGYAAENSPAIEKHYVLAGTDTFDIKTIDFDEENDPIVERKFQYVQNQYYFDNPTGMESFAVTEFSENGNWTDTKASMFNKVGEFRVFRRIKDLPSSDPNFANYSYYSGMPEMIIYAHRKPIANAVLDWDYNAAKGVYKTNWVDLSYDLDHQYSRQDKGIVERKIMFRRNLGEWMYYIPEELTPGNYELYYYVKDVEGVWSDPFTMSFALQTIPPVQLLDAKLRPKNLKFNLNAMPASEYLEVYDAWTRSPYNTQLEIRLYNSAGTQAVGSLKTVTFSTSTGTKTGNDIYWYPIDYAIPETLADGNYKLRVIARDANNTTAQKNFDVTVNTPINLVPNFPSSIATGTSIEVRATTSKYANTVQAILFKGTTYQTTVSLTGTQQGDTKSWIYNYTVPQAIPDGNYTVEYIARTPANKTETRTIQTNVSSFNIEEVTLQGYWNHWRGQVDIFGKQLTNEPHRFLSLETVIITVRTSTVADRIEIRFHPDLESMVYTDPYGHVYRYEDFLGYTETFPLVITPTGTTAVREYSLPLTRSSVTWDDVRQRPQFWMEVKAYKGGTIKTYRIEDIDITGNIYDLIYIQPVK